MILLLFLCLCTFRDCKGSTYSIDFDSPVYIDNKSGENIDVSGMTCERQDDNSTAVLFGKTILKKNITNPAFKLILKKIKSGKQEAVFAHECYNLCDHMEDPDSLYQPYFKSLNIPSGLKCPIEAGTIEIEDMTVDMSSFDINDQQCGDYVAILEMSEKTGESCADFNLFFTALIDISVGKLS